MSCFRISRGIASTSVLLLLAVALPGLAQQEPATPPQPAPAAPGGPSAPPADQPAPTAAAQPPGTGTPPATADQRKQAQEEITVTGSRIRRKDLTTPAPVTVISRQQFETSGKMTIGDYLQAMPEQGNAPNFQLNTGGINYGADGTTRINLRSLGIPRTLILINGRRMVPGGLGASPAVDLNTIPVEAIERIEVLKDGASAVYGSDAIAGVVNVITRHNYNGTDVGAEYGLSGHGDAQTFDAHVTTGTSGEVGSALFSVRYFNQQDSWLRDRSWSEQALDYDYTGGGVSPSGSSRTPQGTVQIPSDKDGNPVCNGNVLCQQMVNDGPWKPSKRWIRDPSGPFCGTTAAGQRECFRVFNTKAPANNNTGNDFYNFAAQNYLTIPSTTIQGYSQGDAKFAFARGYYELSYTSRTSTQNAAPMPLNPADYNNIVVSKDNVYNPFGTDLTFLGRRLVEFGNRTYSEDLGTFHVVAGVDGTLPQAAGPLSNWYWDGSLNYGRTSGTFTTGGSFRNSRVANAVGPSMIVNGVPVCVSTPGDPNTVIPGCSPINLLGGPNNGSIDPSQIGYLGYSGTSRAYDAMFTADANLAGDLFTIAADRPAALALGYQFRRQLGSQIADPIVADGDSADFNFKSTNGGFYANEVYGELSLPLLSGMQGIESLEADVAGRYVNYSTFGGNFSYKLGARYTPIRDVTVRGTYSTAFRAPNINELYLGATETDPAATDPCADLSGKAPTDPLVKQCTKYGVSAKGSGDSGLQELTRQGGNPGLKAETANIITVGVVVQPQMVKNLSITVDYFNVTVDDAIGTIGTPNILQGCYINLNDDYCKQVVRNNAGRIQYVNDLNQNVGQRKTGGIDFAIRYMVPTPEVGRFLLAFDGSWLAFYDNTLKLATGTQTFKLKDYYDAATFGALPQFKATGGVDWSLGGLLAGVTGRYVASFTECANPGDPTTAQGGSCYLDANTINPFQRRVSSYFQLDLHAGYTLASAFGKTSIFAGISNVLDQAPPYIYSAALANSDPSTYDYLGRYIYGRVQHRF